MWAQWLRSLAADADEDDDGADDDEEAFEGGDQIQSQCRLTAAPNGETPPKA